MKHVKYKLNSIIYYFKPYSAKVDVIKIIKARITGYGFVDNTYRVSNYLTQERDVVHCGQMSKTTKSLKNRIREHLTRLLENNIEDNKTLQEEIKKYAEE